VPEFVKQDKQLSWFSSSLESATVDSQIGVPHGTQKEASIRIDGDGLGGWPGLSHPYFPQLTSTR